MLLFQGISSAYSAEMGVVQVQWRPAQVVARLDTMNSDFDSKDCGDVQYIIFIAEAPFQFPQRSVQELSENGNILEIFRTSTATSFVIEKQTFSKMAPCTTSWS